MTALKRSSKSPRNRVPASSAPVSSAKTSASVERPLQIVVKKPRGEPLGHRRLADARLADEHRVVLAAAAEHFDGALELLGASDQRIEQSLTRAFGQVDAVRLSASAGDGGGRRLRRRPVRSVLIGRAVGRERNLGDAMGNEVEDVEPGDALLGQELGRMALRLLENRRQDVAGVGFVPLRALDMENRRLQHAAKRHRLLGVARRAAALALDRFVEVGAERAPQRRQVGAAGGEDSLAVGIVRERVEQMLERQIGVLPRHRFAERDRQDDFKRR